MLVRDRRVADVLVRRAELPRRALEEQAGRASRLPFDDLAQRADVVRRDQRVVPGERRRVARVVDERPEHAAVVGGGDPAHDQGVVGVRDRVEAAHEAAVPALGSGRSRFRARSQRPVAHVSVAGASESSASRRRLEDRAAQLFEVGADQLAAGVVTPAHGRPRRCVGVRAVHEQLSRARGRASRARARAPAPRPTRRRGRRAARCRGRRAPSDGRRRIRAPARSPSAADGRRRRGRASPRPTSARRSPPAGSCPAFRGRSGRRTRTVRLRAGPASSWRSASVRPASSARQARRARRYRLPPIPAPAHHDDPAVERPAPVRRRGCAPVRRADGSAARGGARARVGVGAAPGPRRHHGRPRARRPRGDLCGRAGAARAGPRPALAAPRKPRRPRDPAGGVRRPGPGRGQRSDQLRVHGRRLALPRARHAAHGSGGRTARRRPGRVDPETAREPTTLARPCSSCTTRRSSSGSRGWIGSGSRTRTCSCTCSRTSRGSGSSAAAMSTTSRRRGSATAEVVTVPSTGLQFSSVSDEAEFVDAPPGYRVVELGADGYATSVVRVPASPTHRRSRDARDAPGRARDGAGRGIGRATAIALAASGTPVVARPARSTSSSRGRARSRPRAARRRRSPPTSPTERSPRRSSSGRRPASARSTSSSTTPGSGAAPTPARSPSTGTRSGTRRWS